LSSGEWALPSFFDHDTTADLLTLCNDGVYFASYRAGACVGSGSWTLDRGQLVQLNGYECKLGEASPPTDPSIMPVHLEGPLLIYGDHGPYARPPVAAGAQLLSFDVYDSLVETIVRLDTSGFSVGVPVNAEVVLENRSSTEMYLTSFHIENGSADPPAVLSDLEFAGAPLAPGATLEYETKFSPVASPDGHFTFTTIYGDGAQTYGSRRDAFAPVATPGD
jgi:hypothetical protein